MDSRQEPVVPDAGASGQARSDASSRYPRIGAAAAQGGAARDAPVGVPCPGPPPSPAPVAATALSVPLSSVGGSPGAGPPGPVSGSPAPTVTIRRPAGPVEPTVPSAARIPVERRSSVSRQGRPPGDSCPAPSASGAFRDAMTSPPHRLRHALPPVPAPNRSRSTAHRPRTPLPGSVPASHTRPPEEYRAP